MKFIIKASNSTTTTSDVSWKQAYGIIKELGTDNQYFMEVLEPINQFRNELVKYVFRNDNWLPLV